MFAELLTCNGGYADSLFRHRKRRPLEDKELQSMFDTI